MRLRDLHRRLARLEGVNAGDRVRYVVSARLTSYDDPESYSEYDAEAAREMTADKWEQECCAA